MRIVEQSAELIWATPDSERMIEKAGRTCYKSESLITKTSSSAFVRKLIKSGHHAMLEHASASIKFVTDRGISHEFVRHRIASYAQESTRWCNYSRSKFGDECTFILPFGLDDRGFDIWENSCMKAEAAYFSLLQQGNKPEIARSVLPTSLKTELVSTMNLREWRYFLSLRGPKQLTAHPQIRDLASMALILLKGKAPTVFEDFDYE